MLGVVLEDLRNHPLDEFLPTKFEYEKHRYLSREKIKEMFIDSGFTYERSFRITEQIVVLMDREFLVIIENTSQDSALNIVRDEDYSAFQDGVFKLRKEVERGERTGKYRTYYYGVAFRCFGEERNNIIIIHQNVEHLGEM